MSQQSAQWWDQRYSHPAYVYGERPNDYLAQTEKLLRRGSRVLVLGDGEGRNGVFLAGRGHRVTSVDLSEVGVRKARALAAARGVPLDAHVGDLTDWLGTDPAAGPWDGIVSIFCHLPAPVRAQVGRTLGPRLGRRGWLILESFTPAQIQLGTGGPQDESLLLTRERVLTEWPDLLLDVRLVERRIFEGMGHQGLSSVIQVLGRRRPGPVAG